MQLSLSFMHTLLVACDQSYKTTAKGVITGDYLIKETKGFSFAFFSEPSCYTAHVSRSLKSRRASFSDIKNSWTTRRPVLK